MDHNRYFLLFYNVTSDKIGRDEDMRRVCVGERWAEPTYRRWGRKWCHWGRGRARARRAPRTAMAAARRGAARAAARASRARSATPRRRPPRRTCATAPWPPRSPSNSLSEAIQTLQWMVASVIRTLSAFIVFVLQVTNCTFPLLREDSSPMVGWWIVEKIQPIFHMKNTTLLNYSLVNSAKNNEQKVVGVAPHKYMFGKIYLMFK